MRSASPGSFGAQSTSSPLSSCSVVSSPMASASRWPLIATASKTDLTGTSCRLIATSPKERSRSMSSTLDPVFARCEAVFVDSVVFPTPPLAEKIVMTCPSLVAPPPLCPTSRDVRSRLRRSASARAVWSSAETTSRTPLRSAWVRAVTSTRLRSRMTPSSGRSRRAASASSQADSSGTSAPMITCSIAAFSCSARATIAAVSSDCVSGPSANRYRSSAPGLGSHRMFMSVPSQFLMIPGRRSWSRT